MLPQGFLLCVHVSVYSSLKQGLLALSKDQGEKRGKDKDTVIKINKFLQMNRR